MMTPLRGATLSLCLSFAVHGQSILFEEQFDGTIGYNPDSATALVGEDDWVDFGNRFTTDFNAVEGYTTSAPGGETVLAAAAAAGQNDPQLRTDFVVDVERALVGRIEFRIRIDTEGDNDYDTDDSINATQLSLFYTTSPYGNPGATNGPAPRPLGAPDSIVAESDGWHLLTWNDNGGLKLGDSDWVDGFRLDTVNNLPGTSFEVDRLTLYETQISAEVDPAGAIGPEFTLREEWEWSTDGSLDGWTATNFDVPLPGGVSGGIVSGTSTTGDPQFVSPPLNVLDVTTGRFIVEFGINTDAGDTGEKQLFWATNDGAINGDQRIIFPDVPADDSAHVVRVSFDGGGLEGRLTRLRYDPSDALGITSNIDYIRIYSEGPEIPYNPPPSGELDPASPLGPEYLLVGNWDWNVDDDLDGWNPTNLDIEIPDTGGDTGVFSSAVFGEATTSDPNLTSPLVSVVPPGNGRVFLEVEFAADPDDTSGAQIFWRTSGNPFAQATSLVVPSIPSDGFNHTFRIDLTDDLDGPLVGIRIDPTNQLGSIVGIDAVRIYRDTTGNDYDSWAGSQTWTPGAPGTLENDDFDGDGVSNDDERIFGLVPTDAGSLSPISSMLNTDGDFSYTRRDPALTGATFRIFTSTDLSVWTEDTGATSTPSVGDLQTVDVELTATPVDGRLFVRVESQ